MLRVCLADVNQREHHEDEGLQGNHQNVEDCPNRTSRNVCDSQADIQTCEAFPGTAKHGNQHKYQLASKHVAKQPHAVRDGFGREFNDLHTQVNRGDSQVCAKWCAD